MFRKIIEAYQRHQNFKKTYRELSKLSTRELEDIGIPRSMIMRISLESASESVFLK